MLPHIALIESFHYSYVKPCTGSYSFPHLADIKIIKGIEKQPFVLKCDVLKYKIETFTC